jgi:hypothetical protein
VTHAGQVLSMYMGPDEVLVTVDLDFEDGTLAVEAARSVATLEAAVRDRYPMITRLFLESTHARP